MQDVVYNTGRATQLWIWMSDEIRPWVSTLKSLPTGQPLSLPCPLTNDSLPGILIAVSDLILPLRINFLPR
jgi:hypothetical protein